MKQPRPDELVRDTLSIGKPLKEVKDLEPLIEKIADARVVMLGEASHGTHEFYEWRRIISEWLMRKHGFRFIAVEGDWPPCQDVNRYLSRGSGGSAREILETFRRWPTWMWANTEIIRLVEWMRTQNSRVQSDQRVGFHGLDVYSLFESIESILEELEKINPFLARRARNRYSCFDQFHRDERAYARSLLDFPEGCEDQVVEALRELLKERIPETIQDEGVLFDVRQNARIIRNAEQYYRTMIHADDSSWNVRDRHMMETLDILLDRYGSRAKGIVWAHNTHIGDYRATDMVKSGLVNLGGLAREKYGAERVALVGFGTYEGTVIASPAWEGPIQSLEVPPGRNGSYEAAFHGVCQQLGAGQFFMTLQNTPESLREVRGHRAIGVVYDPAHERWGNYVPTSLAARYDAFLFVDRTQSLKPLIQGFDQGELPETWPGGQ